MNRSLALGAALALSAGLLAVFGSPVASSAPHPPKVGYGLIVGDVKPCTAKVYDASPSNPLIVILSRRSRTYATYDVSADAGTTWYHFDVPVGHYTLTTTWPGTGVHHVSMKLGTTSKENFEATCVPSEG